MAKIPDIVYKYRSWNDSNHKKVITENSLFLASPKLFNDPFDCKIPDNILSLDTDDKIMRYVNFQIEKTEALYNSEEIKYDDNNDFLRDQLKRFSDFRHENNESKKVDQEVTKEEEKLKFYKEIKDNIQKYHIDFEKKIYDRQDKYTGVISLSAVWNNILMWSHYGDEHSGYCIGFHQNKIRHSGIVSSGGMVEYNENHNFPDINPMSRNDLVKTLLRTQNKAKEWSYEEEFRIIKQFFPKVPTLEDRIFRFDDDLFAEITLGVNIDPDSKREIIEIAKAKKIKTYQAVKVPFKFLIERVEI
jgi:hypothetical protein